MHESRLPLQSICSLKRGARVQSGVSLILLPPKDWLLEVKSGSASTGEAIARSAPNPSLHCCASACPMRFCYLFLQNRNRRRAAALRIEAVVTAFEFELQRLSRRRRHLQTHIRKIFALIPGHLTVE